MSLNLLVLGGTTEATALANALETRGIHGTFSYAGRVERPKVQAMTTRVGGFGGAAGLAGWITENGITHVVDATHPFAAGISANAVAACEDADVPLAALTRPPWQAGPEDRWIDVPDIAAAIAALGDTPRRVLLAIGRMHLAAFTAAPWHFYLLRLVDPPQVPPPLPDCALEISRGPFTVAQDTALMRHHRIDIVVSKNSGGGGARAKLDAARDLGLPVVMIDRPAMPARTELHSIEAVFDWLDPDHAGTPRSA